MVHILKSNPIPLNIEGKVKDSPFHPKDYQTDVDGNRLKFSMVSPQDQFVSEVFMVTIGLQQYPILISKQEKFKWT